MYFLYFRSNCEDLKDVLTITIDWALSTIMEAINSLPLEYSIKFKEGKYLLDERNNKYITIKENGKFKITFE